MEENLIKAQTRRDLTITPISEETSIVIACDSCGAIGMKAGDEFALPARYAAQFTARVALTEVLCAGALPFALANAVSCEMEPTGRETVIGIRRELEIAGLAHVTLNGSTEENFKTTMTALGITVIGAAKTKELKLGPGFKGDKLLLLGRPSVGERVDLESAGFYGDIRKLVNTEAVREIVPAGSKGVGHEARALAALNGRGVTLCDRGVDYSASAGPATCLVVLCAQEAVEYVSGICEGAILIGELV